MARIKRTGLDYFPLDIDFVSNRFVRRIMKREGEGALATLINALSCIYGGEGYYVLADELFYEDLSTNLYNQTAEDVKRILCLAVEYGIFHAELFSQYGILTSEEIQRQYLFSTKRRKSAAINPLYCIESEQNEEEPSEPQTANSTESAPQAVDTCSNECASADEDVTFKPQNVTFRPENVTSDTHSIAQNSIAQHSVAQKSKEYPLLNSSPDGETQNADLKSAAEGEAEVFDSEREIMLHEAMPGAAPPQADAQGSRQTAPAQPPQTDAPTPRKVPRREWTETDISRLHPPADGLERNLDGMIFNLRQHRVPLNEQYAIILKSNFGIIGHPVWKGFYDLRESRGKIRFPGRYLLSLCVAAKS